MIYEEMTNMDYLDLVDEFMEYLDECEEIGEKTHKDYERLNSQLNAKICEYTKAMRRIKKTKKYNKWVSAESAMLSFIKTIKNIKEAHDENVALVTDDDYKSLILFFVGFRKQHGKSVEEMREFSKKFIKPLIIASKDENPDIEFLNFFDDNGNLIISYSFQARFYIQQAFEKKRKDFYARVSEDMLTDIIVNSDDLEKARLESLKNNEEERKKKEEEKKRRTDQRKNNCGLRKIEEKKEIVKYTPDPKLEEAKKVFDLNSRELKDGCHKIITLEALISILDPFLDKNTLNRCIDEYNAQVRNERLCRIKRFLTKSEFRKLLAILEITDDENIGKLEFEELITSKEFNDLSDSGIKNKISNILAKILKPNDKLTNYIIFTNNSFINNEKCLINAARTNANTDAMLKSASMQLYTLQTNSIEYLKTTLKSAFHELKDNTGSFIIDNKLKGYRFGPKKAKTCLFTISVHQDNQRVLQKKYNMEPNSKVVLVFGISNVFVEDEYEFYQRAIKYANDSESRLLEIYNIFANPFTPETLPIALELIESGINQIDEFTRESGYQKSK